MTLAKKEVRKFAKASIVWFALMVGLMSFGAFAAEAAIKPKKAAPIQETYSATESEDDTSYAAKPLPLPLPRKPAPRLAARPSVPASSAAVASAAFDPVPSDQAAALILRLKLVERLIQRHGRAYDYRVLTVRDLQALLSQLEPDTVTDTL